MIYLADSLTALASGVTDVVAEPARVTEKEHEHADRRRTAREFAGGHEAHWSLPRRVLHGGGCGDGGGKDSAQVGGRAHVQEPIGCRKRGRGRHFGEWLALVESRGRRDGACHDAREGSGEPEGQRQAKRAAPASKPQRMAKKATSAEAETSSPGGEEVPAA
jgi:hypothetical protein